MSWKGRVQEEVIEAFHTERTSLGDVLEWVSLVWMGEHERTVQRAAKRERGFLINEDVTWRGLRGRVTGDTGDDSVSIWLFRNGPIKVPREELTR